MKKFLALLLLSISTLSCEKDKFNSNKDIPDWLNSQIALLEQEIKSNPSTLTVYSAWMRYEWKNAYYFEFIEPPRSYRFLPKDINGNNLNIADPIYSDYEKEKCCMIYIWKGPKY